MAEPQPVMDQAEQDQLTRQVGRALLKVAGNDWQQVRAEYRSAGRHIEVDVFVTGPDGATRTVRPPMEVVEGLGRLRQGMYRPGRGTWLSALYVLKPPSSFSAEFEPDVEPRWRRMPPPIAFTDELHFFPRAEEHIPEWLRQRSGMRPAGESTPPGGMPGQVGGPPAGSGPGAPDEAGGWHPEAGRPGPPGGPVPGQPGTDRPDTGALGQPGWTPGTGQPVPGRPNVAQPGGFGAPGHLVPPQPGHPGVPPHAGFPPPPPQHPGPPGGGSMSFQRVDEVGHPAQPAW